MGRKRYITNHLDKGSDNGYNLVIGPIVNLWPHPTSDNCSSIMLAVVSDLPLCTVYLSESV